MWNSSDSEDDAPSEAVGKELPQWVYFHKQKGKYWVQFSRGGKKHASPLSDDIGWLVQWKYDKDKELDAAGVPDVIKHFLKEGAEVPIDVLVGEVEALQQAATRLRVNAYRCAMQLEQLEDRQRRVNEIDRMQAAERKKGNKVPPRDVIDGKQKSELKGAVKELSDDKKRFEEAAKDLQYAPHHRFPLSI